MRVAIDIQSTTGRRTGFGYYVLGLLEGFRQIERPPEFVCLKHDRKASMRTHDRILWDQVEFPLKARRSRPDLVHKPCFSGAMFYRGPQLLTVHDIIPYIFPKNVSCTSRMYWNGLLIKSIKRARIITAISEATKRDLVNLLGIDPKKIRVIYLGIFNSFRPRDCEEARKGLEAIGLPEKYFMCVGSLEPRKNLPMLIAAYLSIANKVEEDLVIVGKPAWGLESLNTVLNSQMAQDRVRFLGYVSDDQLPLFYNAATALLFASKYEGFGLPLLEAMASGCPVLSSNNSSIPEVVGNAAMLISPNCESSWSKAIVSISGDSSLTTRMSEAGLARAKKFTWKECAEKTLAVYEETIRMWR